MRAIDKVRISRKQNRKKSLDYINAIFTSFVELHGDRMFADDDTIISGIGKIAENPVVVVAQQKDRNFGMPNPEGYRKCLRMVKFADKFKLPIVSFIDTPGARCGIEAEERGQSMAIANCIYEFSKVRVPTVSIILGEGGSGGALAISVTDEIWMLENSVYSILSPEAFSSILWRSPDKKEAAAQLMRLTSEELYEDGFIDRIIKEDGNEIISVKTELIKFLERNQIGSIDSILRKRKNKYRRVL